MGNVEGKATGGRRRVDPPYCTARPLPPLPNDNEEEDLDLDSPPPYPPPPPPSEERSKRYSWRMSDSAVFGQGENKRRSWLLNLTNGGDKTKSKMAKDGKDVDDVNSKISVGSADVSGGVGVKASFNEPHINIQENSWTVEGKPDGNQTVGNESHVFTYNISDKERSMQGEQVIKMKTEYMRGEDSSAPGYSVLHECLQHDMNSEGRMIHDQNSTQLPSLDLSCTSNISDELKNVIDELRGKPSTEDSTVFKSVSEHKRFVSITTTSKKEVSSHISINGKEYNSTTNDSLSKLEAELSALLSPELELHNSETVNNKNTSVTMCMENGHGSGTNVGLGTSTSQAHSSQVNQSYNISVTPTLPLPDIQEFSGKGIPLLPDLVKGDNKGAITVESSLQGRDKNVNVGAGGSITGPICDVQLDKKGDFGGGRLDAKFDSSLPEGKGKIGGLNMEGNVSGPRLDVSAEGSKIHTPGIALAGENLPRGDVNMSVEPVIPQTPDVGKPAIKRKKQSSGPCTCLSSPKKVEQEEPYISAGVQGNVEGELPSVPLGSVEVEGADSGLRTEATATGEIPQKKRSGPKSKLGSCFGKPKSSEADIPKAEIKGEVEVQSPRITGEPKAGASVNIQVPDEKVKIGKDPEKKKTKFGSCFGKPKEPEYDVKGESYRVISDEPEFEGKVDVSPPPVPQVSLATTTGDINVQTKSNVSPSIKCEIPDLPKVEANVETRAGAGDFKDDFTGDIYKGGHVQIQASTPKIGGKFASRELSTDGEFSRIPGNLDISIPDLKYSIGASEAKIEGSPEANIDGNISLDIEGKAPDTKIRGERPGLSFEGDLPSMHISDEKTNIKYSQDTPEMKIEGQLPEFKGEYDVDLGIDLPQIVGKGKESEIKGASMPGVTVKSDLPDIDVPKGEVSMPRPASKPAVGLKAEVKGPKGSASLDVPSIEPRRKKAKLGPCACLGKSGKMDIEEPYMEKEGEVSGRFENVDADTGIKVEGPRLEGPEGRIMADVESPERKDKKVKVSGKPKMSIGSCFGKAKTPSASASVPLDDNAKASAEPHIAVEGEVAGPSVDVTLPEGKAEIDIESPKIKGKGGKVSGKPKMKFGPCFGKDKDVEGEIEYKFEGPSGGEVSASSPQMSGDVSIEAPKSKIKGEKPKVKLGSCFGKPKEPKVEGEYQAGKIAVEGPEVTSKLDVPSAEASVASPAMSVDISAESPEAKIKGEKPKTKLGSCFGKPKDPKVEGEYKPARIDIESPGASGEVKVATPEIEGDIDVESPKVEIKGEKPKSKLGSCFGKPKVPEAEGEYKPSKLEVEGPSASGKANIPSPEISGDVSAELPKGEVGGVKSKSKLGSCFGKPKEPKMEAEYKPARIIVDEPSVSGEASVKSPELSGDVSIEGPEGNIKGKKPKSKFGSCFGKSKAPEIEGRIESERPEISSEVKVSSPKLKGDIDVESPDVRIKGDKPKAKLGSCFGKPKTPEVEGEYKSGKASAERPEAEAEVSVISPTVKGDINLESPDVKVKGGKPKSKLGSCFGKPKSGEGEYKPSVDIEHPDVAAGAKVKSPGIQGEIDIDSPEVEVKGKKVSGKPKAKLGSCFGKPKEPKVKGEIDIEGPKLEGEVPSGKAEVSAKAPEVKAKSKKVKGKSAPLCASCIGKGSPPDIDMDADIEPRGIKISPEKPSMEGKISVEAPSIDIEPSVKVKGPSMPEVPKVKGDFDIKADIPDFEPSIKIQGDLPDIPKVEAEMGGKADIPEIEIHGNVPSLPKIEASVDAPELKLEGELPKLKTEGDFDIGMNVPSISGDIKGLDIETPELPSGKIEGDIKGDLPSIEIPKAEVSIPAGPELPSAEIKGEVKGPEISGSAKLPKAELKTKKAKLGPCACLGKSGKIGKEEPYMAAEAGGKVSGEVEGVDVGLEGPKGSVAVDVESPDIKGKKAKPKMSLGSCFGKAKPPSARGDISADANVEGSISAEPHIKVEGADIAGPSGDITLPKAKAEVDIESPEVKVKGGKVSGKPKMKFGPCFGKGKDVEVEGEYKPSKVEVEGPSISGEVSAASPEMQGDISVDSPKGKIKGEKPKAKLGSCFGKPKGPIVKGEYQPADVSVEGPEVDGAVDIPAAEVKGDIKVESPSVKIKGEKPKSKLGSCFGKPKTPAVEGEYKLGKIAVEGPEVESEASVKSPEVKSGISVESPDIKVKGGKPKARLGPCFGKTKSGEVEGEYKPGSVAVRSPDVGAGVSVGSPDTECEIDVESPKVGVKGKKTSGKPKAKLGTCFGKPKEPKIEGAVDIERPEIQGEVPAVKADVKASDVKVKSKKAKGKSAPLCASCIGKASPPDVDVEADVKPGIIKISPEKPSIEGKVSVDTPRVIVEPTVKVEGPSVPIPEMRDLKMKFEEPDLKPSVEIRSDIPDIPKVKAELHGSGDIPEMEMKGNAPTIPEIKTSIDSPEINIEGKIPKLKTEGDIDVKVKAPGFSGDIEGDLPSIETGPELPSAEIKGEVKGPTLSGSAEIPKAEIKKKKAKLGPCACIGKGDKMGKEEPYMVGGKVSGEVHDVDVGLEVPKGNVAVDVESPEMKNKKPKALGKPKMSLGSCFGKGKTPSVSGEISTGLDVDVKPGQSDIEISAEAPVPPARKGKKFKVKSPDIDVNHPDVGGIDVNADAPDFGVGISGIKMKTGIPDINGSVDIPDIEGNMESPHVKSNVEIPGFDTSKSWGKTEIQGFGGNIHIPEAKGKFNMPESKGTAEFTGVEGKIGMPEIQGYGGKITIPEINGNANIPGFGAKADIPEMKGSAEIPGFEGRVDIPEIKGSTEIPGFRAKVDMPEMEGKADIHGFGAKVDMPEIRGKADIPGFEGKVNMPGIPSFGAKVDMPEITGFGTKVDMPEIKGKADISGFEGKVDMPEMKGKVDIPGFGAKVDMPEMKGKAEIPGFGAKVEMPEMKGKADIPGFGVKVDMPEMKGNAEIPGFGGKVDMPEMKGKVDIPGFGAKVDMPEIKGKADISGFEGKVDMPEMKGKADIPGFEGKVDMPEMKGKVDIPGFGAKVDMPEMKRKADIPGFGVKVDMPEIKGKADIPGFGGKVDMPEMKGKAEIPGFGAKVDMPEMKGKADIPGFGAKIDMPEMKGKAEIPGFGAKFDMPEMKGKAEIPGFGAKVEMPEMKGKAEIPGFEGKFDMPEMKGKADIPGFGAKFDMPEMKGKADIPGFGAKIDMPEMKGKADIPGFEGKVDMPEMKGKADIPGFEGKVDMPEIKGKAEIPGFGAKIGMPEMKGRADMPGFGAKIDMSEMKGKADIPGFAGKIDMPEISGFGAKVEMPEIKGSTETPGLVAEVDMPEISGFGAKVGMPEIKGKADFPGFGAKVDMPEISGFGAKVDKPEIKGKAEIPGFGAKVDMPEMKGISEIPSFGAKVDMPKMKGKADIPGFGAKVDMPEMKGKAEIPGIEAKVDMSEIKGKADIPGFGARVVIPEIKGFEGKVDMPEIKDKTEISGFGGKIDMPESKGSNDVPGFGARVDMPVMEGKAKLKGFVGKVSLPEVKGETEFSVVEGNIDMPEIEGKVKPSDFEGNVSIPGSKGKVKLPKVKGSAEISPIEGEVDMPVMKGTVKTPGIEGKVTLPKTKGKPGKVDTQEKKANIDTKVTDGKMKIKAEIPNIKSGIAEETANLEGVKVKTKISGKSTKTETISSDAEIRVPSMVTGNGDLGNVSPASTTVTTDIPLTKSKKKRNRANRKKKANSMSEEELEKEKDLTETQKPSLPGQQQTSVSEMPKLQGTVEVSASLPASRRENIIYTVTGSDRKVGDSMIEEYHGQHPVSNVVVVSTGEPTVVSSSAGVQIVSSRIGDDGDLRGNIPEVSVRQGTAPIGWVIPPQTSHSTISHKVIVGDSHEFVVPHSQSITVLPQSQPGHPQGMASGPTEVHGESKEYTISTEAQRAEDVESYIKGKLGPFRLTPDRTLSECKTEVQIVREPYHISPDRAEQHQIHLSPDTSGDWSVGPYSYQVRMETDSEGKLISAPQLTELQSKEDGDSRGSKQSRNVFVTEDAGGRVIVHRRVESQTLTSDQDTVPSGLQTQIVRQDPESSVVTSTEWPESITTHRTVRIRKIKRVRVGDGPEETTVETEYEGDPDTLRLESVEGLESGLTHLLPDTSGESSLLRFGLDQRETPDNTQTVTTTVRRVPADLSHFMEEGYDENLENILGSTTTTTTTRTVRKVKVIRRDEDGNIVEFEDEDGEVSSLPPALTSEDVSTTVSDDGTTTTTTRRIIRERRIITSDLTEDANRSTVRESASGEGEAGSSQDSTHATH
ncbi:neuroblast differentiation-associated protein AHNAK-like isoform X9 [Penaeus japonicus]|uniref:neuroblast differentiation-associated protein AHNAK-like isoform X9 n=1 Tax=Penaeus japonicus TaxID=27405 RepID=UPI001C70BE23|nr:neuroblast differentiation-associated protein AHNAK-like isoform X9 [Penaeus japonicus]